MTGSKHNHFCLIYKFVQIYSRQIQKSFLYNKRKNSAVYIKISKIQKCFQHHLENGQQLIYTDLYQDTLHPSKKNLEQNYVFIYPEHIFRQAQNRNLPFSVADIGFSYESQIRKKSDMIRRYCVTQSCTFHISNQIICPHIERAPPL